MSVKLLVMYDNPSNSSAFEKHYKDVHVPLAGKVTGVRRAELAKVFPKEDGSPTPAYRVAELYFDDYKSACDAIASEDGQTLLADAKQLGQAGVRFLLCDIE
ncbi:MAG: EthD family reductase [Candidatus Eremiobacteraeota bacterium]|nr:EthD family reductase [Candidatus Eremiobacteraeota bacterium]